jgi:hypothetical protein
VIILIGCDSNKLPLKKRYQFETENTIDYRDKKLVLYLDNPLKCPLTYIITSNNQELNSKLKAISPLVLKEKKDTLIIIDWDKEETPRVKRRIVLGNYKEKVDLANISLPFGYNKMYSVTQGFNGDYSHNDPYSKYSLDFNLKKGDTVCASEKGFVVGVIKDYMYGNSNKNWIDYANLITIYHPQKGFFTQYVHLDYNKIFVNLGDSVSKNQPIGLAGVTGWTNGEHLHFVTLVSRLYELESVKINFSEGYIGEKLKVGDLVIKPKI